MVGTVSAVMHCNYLHQNPRKRRRVIQWEKVGKFFWRK